MSLLNEAGTELWLVRHGQTDWNRIGRYQGQADVPLNETGRAQARELAARLAGETFSALYSSDLQRAYETALILGQVVELPVLVDPRLREISQGEWEGRDASEIERLYPEVFVSFRQQGGNARIPGGESPVEVGGRMAQAASAIAWRHPGGRVLVVSHGMAIATLVCLTANIPLGEAYRHIPPNGAPVVLAWKPLEAGRIAP